MVIFCRKVFDQNKDGYVVADEIKYVMTRLGQPMTDDEVDEILRKGDINGDGKLNYTGKFRYQSCIPAVLMITILTTG